MFNIGGVLFTRDGDQRIDITDIQSLDDLRVELAKAVFYNEVDQPYSIPSIPGAWMFPQEESEIYVVPTTPEATNILRQFAEEVIANDCRFVDEDKMTWADGAAYVEDDDVFGLF